MTTFAHPSIATRSTTYRHSADGMIGQLVHRLQRSRSLASMLPALLFSGLMTLVVTGVTQVTSGAIVDGFAGRWMESWLTAWPIAFPVAYLTGPALLRLAAAISAPARMQARQPGLVFGDIADASRRVSRRNGLTVLRGLKPAHDFSAV